MVINLSEETIKTVIKACDVRIQNAKQAAKFLDREIKKKAKQAIKETEEAKAIFEELLNKA